MKILFLAANPKGTDDLQLRKELNRIDDSLQKAGVADRFMLSHQWAIDSTALRRALLDETPDIVHFSGHGTGAEGLVLEGQDGQPQPAKGDALAKLFEFVNNIRSEQGKEPLRCVLLNACFAEEQAKAIFQHIDSVIGMKHEVKDDAAIAFATGFYDGLGRDLSIKNAFALGCIAIQFELDSFKDKKRQIVVELDEAKQVFEQLPDHAVPILFSRESAAIGLKQASLTEALKESGISQAEALKQYRADVQRILADGELTSTAAFQLTTRAAALGITEAAATRILTEAQQLARSAQESESVKQYRAAVQQILADNQLTTFEEIDLEDRANERDISPEAARSILEQEKLAHYRLLVQERVANPELRQPDWKQQLNAIQQAIALPHEIAEEILATELMPIQKAQQDYGNFLHVLVARQLFPFNTEVEAGLKRKQQEKNLTAAEVAEVAEPILQQAKAAHRQRQQQRYEAQFRQAIDTTYPLPPETLAQLKQHQQKLGLDDAIVEQIQQPLIAPKQAEYKEKLQCYEQALNQAIEAQYPPEEETLENLQQASGLQTEDIERIKQPILKKAQEADQAQQRQAAERQKLEHEQNRKCFEAEFRQAIAADYPLSGGVREQLRNRQQELGLRDTEVAEIKRPIVAAKDAAEKRRREAAEQQRQAEAAQQEKLKQAQQATRQDHQANLKRYEEEFRRAIASGCPIKFSLLDELRNLRRSLGLTLEEVDQIEKPIVAQQGARPRQSVEPKVSSPQPIAAERQTERSIQEPQPQLADYEARLKRYAQEFQKAVNFQYPIDCREGLRKFQRSLDLSDEDVDRIEAPIVAEKEAASQNRRFTEWRNDVDASQQAEAQRQEEERFRQLLDGESELSSEKKAKILKITEQLKDKELARLYLQEQLKQEADRRQPIQAQQASPDALRGNYAQLESLLKIMHWQAADLETEDQMLRVMGRQKEGVFREGYLLRENLQQFPRADLQAIDQLWVRYSQGKFGFSVQQKIWQECGSSSDTWEKYERFGDRVGWRKGLWKKEWIPYSQVMYDFSAPRGHLPAAAVTGWGGQSWKHSTDEAFRREDGPSPEGFWCHILNLEHLFKRNDLIV